MEMLNAVGISVGLLTLWFSVQRTVYGKMSHTKYGHGKEEMREAVSHAVGIIAGSIGKQEFQASGIPVQDMDIVTVQLDYSNRRHTLWSVSKWYIWSSLETEERPSRFTVHAYSCIIFLHPIIASLGHICVTNLANPWCISTVIAVNTVATASNLSAFSSPPVNAAADSRNATASRCPATKS